jgi:hypothetical protein
MKSTSHWFHCTDYLAVCCELLVPIPIHFLSPISTHIAHHAAPKYLQPTEHSRRFSLVVIIMDCHSKYTAENFLTIG